jgi:hypothetical protein
MGPAKVEHIHRTRLNCSDSSFACPPNHGVSHVIRNSLGSELKASLSMPGDAQRLPYERFLLKPRVQANFSDPTVLDFPYVILVRTMVIYRRILFHAYIIWGLFDGIHRRCFSKRHSSYRHRASALFSFEFALKRSIRGEM